MKDSEFLRWIHDRFIFQYGENVGVDYLQRLRTIIETLEKEGR